MSLYEAMQEACGAIGIEVPRNVSPGNWAQCPVIGKSRSNTSGRVLIFDDGKGGIAWNWATGLEQRFTAQGVGDAANIRPQRDPEADRRRANERRDVAATCARIVKACTPLQHPYLASKGFPDEFGLVIEDMRPLLPRGDLGEKIAHALPQGEGPFLIVPGWVAKQVTTVQVITPEGDKKNIRRGAMSGAYHRIATGPETWVAEGIATALTLRAALRLLGRSSTVLSAFSASNVCKVAQGLSGARVAADHDKQVDQFGGLGTGEYYARKSERHWIMPPAMGDFNDMHASEGLRAVAMHIREHAPP